MEFYLAQICGVLIMICNAVSVQFKTKDKVLICFVIANLFGIAQYFLLDAITAAVVYIISTIRCIVFYYYEKKDLKPALAILLVFEIIAIISGISSWQNVWSIIPIIVTVVFTYGLWQNNLKVTRISSAITGFGWVFYNIIVRAYVGAIFDGVLGISSIISLIKNKKAVANKDNLSQEV